MHKNTLVYSLSVALFVQAALILFFGQLAKTGAAYDNASPSTDIFSNVTVILTISFVLTLVSYGCFPG